MAWLLISFLMLNNFFHCLIVPQFIYSFTFQRTSWLILSFGNMNKASINICMHKFSIHFCKYQGAQLVDRVVKCASFCKKSPNYPPNWWYHLASHQQWRRVPIAPHPPQHLVLSEFWILAILIGVELNLLVLISSSLMICDAEHFFVCLVAISMSITFGEMSVQIFAVVWVFPSLPKFLCWNSNCQGGDNNRRWGLWEVIRSWMSRPHEWNLWLLLRELL